MSGDPSDRPRPRGADPFRDLFRAEISKVSGRPPRPWVRGEDSHDEWTDALDVLAVATGVMVPRELRIQALFETRSRQGQPCYSPQAALELIRSQGTRLEDVFARRKIEEARLARLMAKVPDAIRKASTQERDDLHELIASATADRDHGPMSHLRASIGEFERSLRALSANSPLSPSMMP